MATTEDYKNTQIMTATPMELIMMLYDDCIRTLNKTEQAFEIDGPGYLQEVNNSLLHAQDIITELSVSLDMDKGGEIALNLQRLYDFMVNHLGEANVRKDVGPVREVRDLMLELRETWQQVAERNPDGSERPALTSNTGDPGILAAG